MDYAASDKERVFHNTVREYIVSCFITLRFLKSFEKHPFMFGCFKWVDIIVINFNGYQVSGRGAINTLLKLR